MFRNVIIFGIIVIFAITIGMVVEYVQHPHNAIRENAYQLKMDILAIIKGLLDKPRERHIFDIGLSNEFKAIVEPYSAPGMDIDTIVGFNDVPMVRVEFVPEHKLEVEEISTLSERVKLKFRRYYTSRGLAWRCFSTYTQCDNFVQMVLYYGEFAEDMQPLMTKYQEVLREKNNSDFGKLRDEDLDKELKGLKK